MNSGDAGIGKGMWYEWMEWKFSEHLRIDGSRCPRFYWWVVNRVRFSGLVGMPIKSTKFGEQ